MQPYNVDKIYKSFSRISKHVVLYLPRTSDLNQIAKYTSEGKKLEVAHYCIKGASKVCSCFRVELHLLTWSFQALCVYVGDFSFEPEG